MAEYLIILLYLYLYLQGYPAVRPELDLVEPEDQLTHEISLEDVIDPETSIGIRPFSFFYFINFEYMSDFCLACIYDYCCH